MIELKNVSKRYDGQKNFAVEELSLTVQTGETCVLLGPSGCGKSTTLRLINRMIEATSGEILIDGHDIHEKNPDELRMGIGYVIQLIGLLPHRTIGENVAIVPRLYGWPKDKIRKRINELLELMGLEPEIYRDKYPAQLSGGQMQRVGVARAMAVDPPIMLMDEPFGAVDPIVRNYLQDEFLRLQREMKKTICFVTHDIDEAIKMGDKIAIFNEGRLVQHGTPKEILTYPANDFIKDFIGTDRLIKKLHLASVKDAVHPCGCIVSENELSSMYDRMNQTGSKVAVVLDGSRKPMGLISASDLEGIGKGLDAGLLRNIVMKKNQAFVQESMLLRDALGVMFEYNTDYVGVLRGEVFLGVVSFQDIRNRMSQEEGV